MKSIKTPGMVFIIKDEPEKPDVHYGISADKMVAASCWQPSLKERLLILFGKNIMAVFVDRHPSGFYLKTSKQKESK